jgi:Alpha galactosidase A/Alpha galactosidase C-terminal beta sandwich domain
VLQQGMRVPRKLAALLGAACIAACAAAAPAGAAPSLSWSGAVAVDAGRPLSGISCPSDALCVAVDKDGGVLLSTDPAAGPGASWVRREVDAGRALNAISCASPTLCVAVDAAGNVLLSADPAAGSPAGSSASWSSVEVDAGTALTSVSCPSSTLCVAVDGKGNVLLSTDPAAGFPAGAAANWSTLGIDSGAALTSVSCASFALCVAVDDKGQALIGSAPADGASAWHARAVDPGLGLVAVSCFASDSCIALDSAGNGLASADVAATVDPSAAPGSGATWSSTAFDVLGSPNAVSCVSTGLCVATDGTGGAFASDDPTAAPPSWPTIAQTPSAPTGVACVAEGLCAIVTAEGRVASTTVPAPVVTTGLAQEATRTTALLTGTIVPGDATLTACRFEYGPSTEYGASVPCAGTPSGGSLQSVSAVLANLTANTTYHYRLMASSAIGTSDGADETFKTLPPSLAEPHPSIAGIPAPGQRLTCRSGVTAGDVALTYAWLRDLTTIAGASGSTYLVGEADVTHHLQCRVTATTAEGSKSATSVFVTVPAGGLGAVSETTVGAPHVGHDAVGTVVKCSRQAAGGCTLKLRLTVLETLRGGRIVALAARARRARSRIAALASRTRRVTVTVGANTVRLKPSQQGTATVALNATGRRLLAHARRMAVKLSVSGTVVGAISASLRSATLTLTSSGKAAARGSAHRSSGAAERASLSAGQTSLAAGRASVAPATGALAATPYMGWDTYFTFGANYNEASVLEQASQLLTRGLERDGYNYVWLDVGWWQGTRNAAGQITVNPTQWPHGMAWLTSTLHAAGFRVGLYTDAGRVGCGGPNEGSYGHYQQDVDTFAAWGFDAVKVDFCGGVRLGLEPAAAYAAFHQAIVHNASHRPMLLSICDFLQPGQFAPEDPALANSAFTSYGFGPSSGNSWRTDTDVGTPGDVPFSNVLRNLDADAAQPQAAGPGHWNDPDYLGPDQSMSAAQFRTQFSMWAMLAAPLMVSADLISLTNTSQTTISNREAIAIDQDPAGLQARLLASNGNGQVWVKPLSDGSRAIALLNRGPGTLQIATSAAAVGMPAASGYLLRNIWTGTVMRISANGSIAASVPGESTVLLRISAQ